MTPSPIRALRPLAFLAASLVVIAACSAAGASPSVDVGSPGASAEPSAEASGGTGTAECPTSEPAPLPAGETRDVTIATSLGDIVINVEADLSPIAAGNFVALSECGYYDGVVFHRLVPGFVIQGGDGEHGRAPDVDPNLVGTGGPGYTITDEPVTTEYGRGTVAMARSSGPNSVGSQFFIVLDDQAAAALADPSYNNYQIIGTVTSGMEVVDEIAAMPNSGGQSNAALQPIPMADVTVSTP
jgi:cyclophilin family peptidyl-prolyl cis-trans isomerase